MARATEALDTAVTPNIVAILLAFADAPAPCRTAVVARLVRVPDLAGPVPGLVSLAETRAASPVVAPPLRTSTVVVRAARAVGR